MERYDMAVRACWEAHRAACEGWQEGEPVEAWREDGGVLCIRYASGRWWHYRETSSGGLEWY